MENLLPTDPDVIQSNSLDDAYKTKFDLSPDSTKGKLVITGYGDKGSGKTSGIFLITTGKIGGFPCAKTNAISFDNKTKTTRDQWFPDDHITVYDGKRYYRDNPDEATKTGMLSYVYLIRLIESWKDNQPDWIVFDGFTIMTRILESAMRFKYGLKLTEGFANRSLWKDRTAMIRDLHNIACRTAKYGVVYATYSDQKEIVIEGTTVAKEDVPAYIDVIMEETDVVLHMTKAKGKEGDLFYVRVDSTKYRQYPGIDGNSIPFCDTTLSQGRTFNITGLHTKIHLSEETSKISDKVVDHKHDVPEPIYKFQTPTTALPIPIKTPETTAKPQERIFEIPDISSL